MADELQNTLAGQNVTSGFDALLQDLPPEAQAAARQLLQISSAPTEEEKQAAQAQTAAAYAPVLQAFGAQQAPAPLAEPAQSSPLQQFLTLLASNVASTVHPSLGEPGFQALEQEKKETQRVREVNQFAQEKFRTGHAERGLELAAQMAKDSLAAAAAAGDDRAAAQKALQLARVQDALARRKQGEGIAATGEQRRQTVLLENREALKRAVAFKKAVTQQLETLKLSPAGLMRLRANANFLSDYITNASKKDPMTGVAEMTVQDAIDVAQQKFDTVMQDQLQKEGLAPKDTTAGGGGGLLSGDAAARVKARIADLEKNKQRKK